MWLNNFNAIGALCGAKPATPDPAHPTLWDFGFYRRLTSGELEFVSVCTANAQQMVAVTGADFTTIMNKLPKGEGK